MAKQWVLYLLYHVFAWCFILSATILLNFDNLLTVTVVAIAAVVVAGMLAVSDSIAVVAGEMIETGSSQEHFCKGRHSNF